MKELSSFTNINIILVGFIISAVLIIAAWAFSRYMQHKRRVRAKIETQKAEIIAIIEEAVSDVPKTGKTALQPQSISSQAGFPAWSKWLMALAWVPLVVALVFAGNRYLNKETAYVPTTAPLATTGTSPQTTIQTLPLAPSNVQATALDSTHVQITWEDNSGGQEGFRVSDAETRNVTVSQWTTSYTFSDITPGLYRCFHVQSFNSAGSSAWSDYSCVTTPNNAPTTIQTLPLAPSNVQATALDSTHILITWNDNSGGQASFRISDAETRNVTVNPGTTSYTFSDITPGLYRCFHVQAFNSAGSSAWTDYSCVTTPNNAPTIAQAPKYTLSVIITPSGAGSVSPSGGIYTNGTVVTLTANPSSGWSFQSWSGAASGSSPTVTVTMDSDKSVSATFQQRPRFNVTISGSGTVNQSPLPGSDGRYTSGTVVTLTANPASGWSFQSWSGAASGNSPTVTVTMDSDKSVSATFQQRFSLGVTISGSGYVNQSPSPGSDSKYASGTLVTLTANPSSGWSFQSWSGAVNGSSPSVTVTMDSDKSVSATFQQRFNLSVTASGSGGIIQSPSPGSDGKYASGTVVTLTAYPATDWSFQSWSGDTSGTQSPLQVTMDRSKNIIATFTWIQVYLNLTANPSQGGTVVGGGTYNMGNTATIQAIASSGWVFAGWSGDASGTQNPLQVTMDRNKTIVANFTQTSTPPTPPACPPGTGPGGITAGDYDPTTLTQEQRDWLFHIFGHSGTAPVGYGGERCSR